MRRLISKVVQKLFGRRKAADHAPHGPRGQHGRHGTDAAHGAHSGQHPHAGQHAHRATHAAHPHKGLPAAAAPVIVKREEHTLSRSRIDEDALKVLHRLARNNHTAFLVGGGVRDLLLDRPVKDFDISTSAHPNEVKHLFRNCRLIGRRFRLAHILFHGGKVIEVATFRKQAGFSDEGDDLLIKSDNTFGTPEEDALRRDFTINGLFYNIEDFSVIDYVGGLEDLKRRVIRTIGDPNIRLREDPIRTLRAIRLAARLDFAIDPATRQAMTTHRDEIWKCAAPRIVDEFVRMLNQGAAAASFPLLAELDVLAGLLPGFAKAYADPQIRGQVQLNLESLDAHQKPQGGLPPGLALAVLYHPLFAARLAAAAPGTDPGRIAAELLEADLAKLKFPRAQLEKATLLLGGQQRLTQPRRRRGRGGAPGARPWFAEALTLFEITQAHTPEGRAALGRLQAQYHDAASGQRPPEGGEAPAPGEGQPEAAGTAAATEEAVRAGSGRRRRRSRRGRGRGRGQATPAGESAAAGAEPAPEPPEPTETGEPAVRPEPVSPQPRERAHRRRDRKSQPARDRRPQPSREREPQAHREREPELRRDETPEDHRRRQMEEYRRRKPDEDRPIDPDAAFGDRDSDLEPPGAEPPDTRAD